MADQATLRNLVRRLEKSQRNREIESRALLAKVGRCEVDDDAMPRPNELCGGDAATDAFLRLLASAVSKSDDREDRSTRLEERFDFDPSRVEPDERMGNRSGEHLLSL